MSAVVFNRAHWMALAGQLGLTSLCFRPVNDLNFEWPGLLEVSDGSTRIKIAFDMKGSTQLEIFAHAMRKSSGEQRSLVDELIAAVFAPLLRAMKSIGGIEWRHCGLSVDEMNESEPGWLGFEVDAGESTFGCLIKDVSEDPWVFRADQTRVPRDDLHYFRKRIIPGTILIGTRYISAAQLSLLKVGDVLLDVCEIESGNADALRARARWGLSGGKVFQVPVLVEWGHTTVTEEIDLQECSDEIPPSPFPMEEEVMEPVQDVRVPVQVQLGTVALSLAELEAMQPGYILQTGLSDADLRVQLVAQGSLIGTGQLVSVGQRMGIKVTRMVKSS